MNPAKFPAQYIEPNRHFIPCGRRALSRTPPKAGERARSEDSALKDIKAGEMRENVAIFKGIYSFLNTVPAPLKG